MSKHQALWETTFAEALDIEAMIAISNSLIVRRQTCKAKEELLLMFAESKKQRRHDNVRT